MLCAFGGNSRKGLISTVLTAVLFVVLFIGSPSSANDCWDHSLRLLTYNTAFTATFVSNEDIFKMDDDDRAKIIADRILAQDVDVVTLQEVFVEDAKEEFYKKLSPTFPYVVYKLDPTGPYQDSGLMLFSRHPFVPLPRDTHQIDDPTPAPGRRGPPTSTIWSGSIVIADGKMTKDAAVIFFEKSKSWDSYAYKGVGLVRVQNPCTNQYVTIAFTHLQASYDDCAEREQEIAAVRMSQLEDVKRIIKESLHSNQLKSDQIYFMGDLNINGNPHTMKELFRSDLPKCSGGGRAVPPSSWKPGVTEWEYHFEINPTFSRFFAGTLTDTWGFNTSKQDIGQTSGGGAGDVGIQAFPYYPKKDEGFRFDYIFHSKPESQTCMQHITRAYGLAATNGTHLSDHIGVKLDANRAAQYCSPIEPYENPPNDDLINGIIQYKGSMQWYRIDQPGCYSIETFPGSGTVEFDVYEAKDLSRPLASYFGEQTEWGLKFALHDPPYYIRVYSKDRSWVGLYSIRFHLHQGRSPEDSIGLWPAKPYLYTMPNLPLNDENKVWFDFHTGKGETDKLPSLNFFMDHFIDHPYELKLRRSDTLDPLQVSQSRGVSPDFLSHIRHEFSLDDLPAGKYFLVVKPDDDNDQVQGQNFIVEWQTSLTYFHPFQMKCDIQDDWLGDDDIHYQLHIDGTALGGFQYLAEFDEETSESVKDKFGILAFTDNYTVRLYEEDHGFNFRDDHWGSQSISFLAHDKAGCTLGTFEWSQGDTYKYHLNGTLCRQKAFYREDE
jgi:hypothetical protein